MTLRTFLYKYKRKFFLFLSFLSHSLSSFLSPSLYDNWRTETEHDFLFSASVSTFEKAMKLKGCDTARRKYWNSYILIFLHLKDQSGNTQLRQVGGKQSRNIRMIFIKIIKLQKNKNTRTVETSEPERQI